MASAVRAFLVGPGGKRFDALNAAIATALANESVSLRKWGIPQSGSIMAEILRSLGDADVVLADLRGKNPNVLYEVGAAHALHRPVIFFHSPGDDVPFDIADQFVIAIDDDQDPADQVWLQQVRAAVADAIAKGPDTPFQAADVGPHTSGDSSRLHRYLERMAATDRLPALSRDDVALDEPVFHLDWGLGRIAEFIETPDASPVRVTLLLESGGRLGLTLPNRRVFSARDVPSAHRPA